MASAWLQQWIDLLFLYFRRLLFDFHHSILHFVDLSFELSILLLDDRQSANAQRMNTCRAKSYLSSSSMHRFCRRRKVFGCSTSRWRSVLITCTSSAPNSRALMHCSYSCLIARNSGRYNADFSMICKWTVDVSIGDERRTSLFRKLTERWRSVLWKVDRRLCSIPHS